MKRAKIILPAFFGLVLLLFWAIWHHGMRGQSANRHGLMVYCAAAFQEPFAEVVKEYRSQTGEEVAVRFGGSGSMLAQLELAGGDLYLPADESYLEPLQERGLLRGRIPLCDLWAGIAVAAGNPRNIVGVEDLARQSVRVALCDRSAAIGLHLERCLGEDARWRRVAAKAVVTMGTVTEVAQAVSLGVVDAGVVWDVVAQQFEAVDFIKLDEAGLFSAHAAAGVLESPVSNESAVRRFLEFLAQPEGGGGIFRKHGYKVSLPVAMPVKAAPR